MSPTYLWSELIHLAVFILVGEADSGTERWIKELISFYNLGELSGSSLLSIFVSVNYWISFYSCFLVVLSIFIGGTLDTFSGNISF